VVGVRRWVWALAALLAGAASVPARADKKKPGLFDFAPPWKTRTQEQRDDAKQITPGRFDLTPAPVEGGDVRTLRLRIYVDRDYRRAVLRWQPRARLQIDRVNRVVEPVFNVRFEIESLRQWDSSHVAQPLDGALDELRALDPGNEVDWVLGLVAPLQGVTNSTHKLGVTTLLSRVLVLRAMDDNEEAAALAHDFDKLPVAEREGLYEQRKTHKEVALFLHEWGHSLGALHTSDPTVIMNAYYDAKVAAFSDFEKRLIALALERRLAHRDQPHPDAAAVRALMEHAPRDEGSDRERAELVAMLRAYAEPFATAAAKPSSAPAKAAGPAADLAPLLDEAAFLLQTNDLPGAATAVAKAATRLGQGTPDRKICLRLARLAGAVGALTTADAALARAGAADADVMKVASEVDAARRRLALPRDGGKWGVPPEQEPAYAIRYWDTAGLVSTGDLDKAKARFGEFAAAYPRAPGTDVLACDLELRAKRGGGSAQRCQAALAKFDEATRAHYLLGVAAARARRATEAEQHFRKAIALDPHEPGAWRELARHYKATGANSQLSQLAAMHQALLSQPLPTH
jgi:tetratricopeptide (TPR) repeat protein